MIRYSDLKTAGESSSEEETAACTDTLLHINNMKPEQNTTHIIEQPDEIIYQANTTDAIQHTLSSSTSSESLDPEFMCRICRCEAGSEPFISPCYCSGSLQYVHQSCLMQWLKANDRVNKHHCELCQYEFLIKPRPWVEWQMPSLSVNEQRRATCLVVICILAVLIVIWSINDLVQNVQPDKVYLNWGFWTKLLFIAFGMVILGFQYPTFRYFFLKLHDSNQIVLLNKGQDSLEEGLKTVNCFNT